MLDFQLKDKKERKFIKNEKKMADETEAERISRYGLSDEFSLFKFFFPP